MKKMGGKSRTLLWPSSVRVSIRHPSEDVNQAVGSVHLELSRKVRAGGINLRVISVQMLL